MERRGGLRGDGFYSTHPKIAHLLDQTYRPDPYRAFRQGSIAGAV